MACKQYLTSVVKEKRRQQILKAGKGTPVVGKACLEAKEPMEGGEVVETGFDRPVQGVDSAGIRDELYRAEGKPSQVLVDRLSALCFREPGTPRVFTRGTAMLACELGQSAAHWRRARGVACFLRGRADPGSSPCLPTVPSALFTPEVHAGGEGQWRDSILLSPWKSFPAPEVYRKKRKDRMPCRTRSSSPRILSPRGSMTLTWNLLLQRLFHGPKIIPLEGLFVLEDNLGARKAVKIHSVCRI